MDVRRWRLAGFFAVFLLLAIGLCPYLLPTVPDWRNSHVEAVPADPGPQPDTEQSTGSLVLDEVDPDDFALHLHPERHIHRKAGTIELEWNVTRGLRRPDGVARNVYLIDGQFPGPVVEGRSGDEIVITIYNQLESEEIAFHWHGLRISNSMDGTAGLTQCPVAPGRSFTYRLLVPEDQAGTFWYYSTTGLQRADGLFGAFVVHEPMAGSETVSEYDEYGYSKEQVLMVGDWYHALADEVFEWYTDVRNNAVDPTPDSLLLNGKGYFDCSRTQSGEAIDCEHTKIPHLKLPVGRNRLRVINTGSSTSITISVSGYVLRLLQVDGGHRVQESGKYARRIGLLHPGERVDFLVEREVGEQHDSGWITISLHRETMQLKNLALTATQQFPISIRSDPKMDLLHKTESFRPLEAQIHKNIDLARVSGVGVSPLELAADENFMLYTTTSASDNHKDRPEGVVNGTSWLPPPWSASLPALALARSEWPGDLQLLTPTVARGAWVDVVLNNLDDKAHPFHFHGNSFYVLASHDPSEHNELQHYNPFSDGEPPGGPLDLLSPLIKDTIQIPRMGYAVLRFKADNPGLWLLQCQTLWHGAIGMGIVFEVLDNDEIPALKDIAKQSCEDWG